MRDSDRDLIRRALAACADGPFFEEWEFHTLFGLTRAEFSDAARRWTEPGPTDPDVEGAVSAALNNLLGYPHSLDDQLQQSWGLSRQQLHEVFRRWQSR